MYEEILGRPASVPEAKMLKHGFKPEWGIGDKARVSRKSGKSPGKEGKIDAIVLFAVPPLPNTPGAQLAWGYRLEGMEEYLPQSLLYRIEN